MNTLTHYGLSVSVLQAVIIGGVILVVIGTYWKLILSGFLVLFSFMILVNTDATVATVQEPIVQEASVSKPAETEKQRWHRQFLEDCTSVAENSKETCENIWNDRMMDEAHLQVNPNAELSNASYKKRKAKFL